MNRTSELTDATGEKHPVRWPVANRFWLGSAAILLAAGIFAVDLSLPLGVAGGVPYVALVLLGWWFESRRHIVLLGAISTLLIALGFLYSPAGVSRGWL